jgi:hypothetical protein
MKRILAGCIFLQACTVPDFGDLAGEVPLRTVTDSQTTGSNSSVWFDVEVNADETSMLLTFSTYSSGEAVYVAEVQDPAGNTLLDGDEAFYSAYSLTYAYWPDLVATLNWPILNTHADLTPGTWRVRVTTLDANNWDYKSDVSVKFQGLVSDDTNHAQGELRVRITYTGGTDEDASVVAAVNSAKSQWQDIYAQAGVTVTFTESTYGPDTSLQAPSYGSGNDYLSISADSPVDTVNLVIVPAFTGSGMEWTLGLAGGIPGPLVSTANSAVAVSAAAHMGGDLQFDAQEQRIFAETMAHEVGHFIGLFHPVEEGYDYYDALPDTSECTGESNCEDALSSNLMYFITVCDGAVCDPQEDLTSDQSGVMNRYIGVY